MDDRNVIYVDYYGGTPIETLDNAAIIVAALVSQGRIAPVRESDLEARTLLNHLVRLVVGQEPK